MKYFSNLEKRALIIVDMQEKFLKELKERNLLIKNINNVVSFFKEKQSPIYIMNHNPEVYGYTTPEISNRLKNYAKIFNKYCLSPFKSDIEESIGNEIKKNIDFNSELKNNRIIKLVISGIKRHACLSETIKDATNLNYKVFTSENLTNYGALKIIYNKSPKIFKTHNEMLDYLNLY